MKTILFVFLSLFLISVTAHVAFAGVTKRLYHGQMAIFFNDQNGYDDAKFACEAEYLNSHVCVDSEVAIIAQTDSLFVVPFAGGVRFIDMSLNHEPLTGNPVNDCRGYTSNSTFVYSTCLMHRIGGPILPSFCDCGKMLSFICCVDAQ